jgi:4a-hydroxytetrahydrobiopterin dehydratase
MTLLSEVEIERELGRYGGWERDGAAITREWAFADFAHALDFVVRVGAAAEAADHHPDILLHGWNKVRLTLSTHSQGGLTESDFSLAGKIDELA